MSKTWIPILLLVVSGCGLFGYEDQPPESGYFELRINSAELIANAARFGVELGPSNQWQGLYVAYDDSRIEVRRRGDGAVVATGIFSGATSDSRFKIKFGGRFQQLALDGQFHEGEVRGSVLAAGNAVASFATTEVRRLWVCGNHEPHHAAESTEEMRKLTEKEHCEDWSESK